MKRNEWIRNNKTRVVDVIELIASIKWIKCGQNMRQQMKKNEFAGYGDLKRKDLWGNLRKNGQTA